MDQRDGGCEVLAADSHRDPQPRGAGYSDCVCGWVEGVPGGNPERIPQDTGAAVHRTHGAQQPELRELERTKNGGGGFEAGVPCGNVEEAEQRLCEFEQKWNQKYSSIGQMWR